MNKISERVKERMRALDFTQNDLAGLCGVKQPQISLLVRGLVDNPTYIYELARALETSVKWLKTGVEDLSYVQGVSKVVGGMSDVGQFHPHVGIQARDAGREMNRSLDALLDLYRRTDPEIQKMFDALRPTLKCEGENSKKKPK